MSTSLEIRDITTTQYARNEEKEAKKEVIEMYEGINPLTKVCALTEFEHRCWCGYYASLGRKSNVEQYIKE